MLGFFRNDMTNVVVEELCPEAQSIAQIYNSIFADLTGETMIKNYDPYPDNLDAFTLENDGPLVAFYDAQQQAKLADLEANTRRLCDPKDPTSLIVRSKSALTQNASGTMDRVDKGYLLDVIRHLVADNDNRRDCEEFQTRFLRMDRMLVEENFEALSRMTEFEKIRVHRELEIYVLNMCKHELSLAECDAFGRVMTAYAKQVEEM